MASTPYETVQLNVDKAAGVTQYDGTHVAADTHGNVTIDPMTAAGLKRSGAVRSARKVYAIPPLPWKQPSSD